MGILKQKTDKTKELLIQKEEYKKYRWFFTKDNHLVVGGKNAEQNEEIVKSYLKIKPEYTIMHTKDPGSPFSIILTENPSQKDIEETAIFTGCFSKAWKETKKKTIIDIFKLNQLTKNKSMKTGTFGVIGKITRKEVELKLYLTKQTEILRAVPHLTKDALCIRPGKINKPIIAEQIAIKLEIPEQEVLQALPTGGSQLCS